MGYDAEHDCPWRRLGVPQLEGPPPEFQSVREHGRMAKGLVALGRKAVWGQWPAGSRHLEYLENKFQEAVEQCQLDMEAVLAERKKLGVNKEGRPK